MSATITMTTPGRGGEVAPVRSIRAARQVDRCVSDDTYRRRRAVVGVVAALVACGVVLTHDVLTGSGGVPASAAASQSAPVRSGVVAQPGDTLWSIAQTYHGDVSVSRYVDKLVSLNDGASIQAGQRIVLP